MLNIIDEFTHECLAIRVDRRLKSIDVIDVLSDLFILRGVPGHIRSGNGPEFVAKAVQKWITAIGAKTAYITPGSPWENGFIESEITVTRLAQDHFYVLSAAVAQLHDLDQLNWRNRDDEQVTITDVTDDYGVLVLAGFGR